MTEHELGTVLLVESCSSSNSVPKSETALAVPEGLLTSMERPGEARCLPALHGTSSRWWYESAIRLSAYSGSEDSSPIEIQTIWTMQMVVECAAVCACRSSRVLVSLTALTSASVMCLAMRRENALIPREIRLSEASFEIGCSRTTHDTSCHETLATFIMIRGAWQFGGNYS
jgi:hypothetical protein